MANLDIVLFTVDEKNICRVGLPPKDAEDDFHARAVNIGKFENASKIAYSPDGKIYAVRGEQLYEGLLPSSVGVDWFSEAQLVGNSGWDQFKLIFFHPSDRLYAVTHDGHLYKGIPPTIEDESWINSQAKRLNGERWNEFTTLFYDPMGMLYGATPEKLVKGIYPNSTTTNWVENAEEVGNGPCWGLLSHFMAFTPDDHMWCVNKSTGEMLTGPPPTNSAENWEDNAQKLGSGFQVYKHLLLMKDKTINTIQNLTFLPGIAKTSEEQVVKVKEQNYNNKEGSASLSCTFEFETSFTENYTFSKEHGLQAGAGADPTFTIGMPTIAEDGLMVFLNKKSQQKWNIMQNNTIQFPFSLSTNFDLPAGTAVTLKATLQKATMKVPYRAAITTMFGNKVAISGMLTGVGYYNLQIQQDEV
ncbi:hypothetical protein NDU88_006893 [Pleurodeles waltl]|uniref:Tachylectin 2 domain-containing protein n=1 Tax=Pleurodeles waltl TaxID=8319 RepID=A0AAV7WBW3_PLEWA|nr:hypothetical protein NDU88_006893 [Pleurodeles waltl]